jgi:hypothetical protein
MAREKRGKGEYYYGKERRGTKVVSVYYGNGILARMVEAGVEAGKFNRELFLIESRRMRARVQRRAQAIEAVIRPMFASVEKVFHSAMIAAGFHRYHRQWRRRRGGRMDLDSAVVNPTATGTEEPRRLFDRIEQTTIDRFRGDMSGVVENVLLKACSKDPLQRELIRRDVAQRRAELAGDKPTVIESMLADRAAFCWLDVQVADRESRVGRGSEMLGLADRDYFQRRVDRAQKRFLAAARALVQLRKLALPVVLDVVNREPLHRTSRPGSGTRK